ncbi:MAG: hypothetical protein ACF8QF_11420 [Phycisphaerales bacterium]
MTSLRNAWTVCALVGFGGAALLAGCGESNETPEAAPAPAPVETSRRPDPVRPPVASLEMDDRVEFPADRVPTDPALAQAIANLASALIAGDGAEIEGVLNASGDAVLSDLQARGSWEDATAGIERVRVTRVESRDGGAQVGVAVQDASGAYLLGWEALQIDGAWVFGGLAIEPQSARTLAELDAAPLTIRMTPVASAAAEAAQPAPPPIEEQDAGGGGGGTSRRGINR